MNRFTDGTKAFDAALSAAEARGGLDSARVGPVVADVIARVRAEGDAALFDFTRRFDRFDPSIDGIEVPASALEAAWRKIPASLRESLLLMAQRIEDFHHRQVDSGFVASGITGATIAQRALPVSRAGIYVPGGKAAYPSTLLMNAIPASVAGVDEIVAACAAPGGVVPAVVLAAAHLCGVSRVFRIGGAQAIAAMAYGTESVPRVDVIAGPGNSYVTEAKRRVYGTVGIDMLAGPSELVVLADDTADAACVAADLLSQAEHSDDSFVALVTTEARFVASVSKEVAAQSKALSRKAILEGVVAKAPAFVVRSLERGTEVVDRLAPEHLSLMTADPWDALSRIRNAGTAFLGRFSPVAVGDYIAGINHTLPTGGAARFSSPLGVYTFMKLTNVVSYGVSALSGDAPHVVRLAKAEGLTAHAAAVIVRASRKGGR